MMDFEDMCLRNETMKRKFRLMHNLIFVTITLVLCVAGSDAVVYGDEVIPASAFGDANLYNFAIENYDTNGNGQLEKSEAEAVSRIELYSKVTYGDVGNIEACTSFKGLEQFTNLKYFEFNGETGSNITDISVLNNFPNMRELTLRFQTNITDFSVLSELTKLEKLDLGHTNFNDASILKNLTKLKKLVLADAKLINFSTISGLSNLEDLTLQKCGLTNISFLSSLNKLQHIDLQHNNITNFSVLTGLKDSLISISIGNCQQVMGYALLVEDLQFLTEMTNLKLLTLLDSGITELPDLSGLTKLTSVSLSLNSLYVSEVFNKLPTTITSRENWITETGMDMQYVEEQDTVVPGTSGGEAGENESDVDSEDESESNTSNKNENNPEENETSTNVSIEDNIDETGGNETEENETETNEVEDEENGENEQETDEQDEGDLGEGDEDSSEGVGLPRIEDIRANFKLKMWGVFEGGIYVIAKEILDLNPYEQELTKLYHMFDNVSEIKLYDVAVYDKLTNERVQPIGMVKVSIEMDVKENTEYYVLRLEDDGEWTMVKSETEDGSISFYSDHFSIYSVVMVKLAERLNISEDIENDSGDERKLGSRLDAGVGVTVVVIIVLAVVAYEGLRRFVVKRKKNG